MKVKPFNETLKEAEEYAEKILDEMKGEDFWLDEDQKLLFYIKWAYANGFSKGELSLIEEEK